MMSNERTVLVTGGAGFIGSHLVRRFVQSGHKCLVVDNLFRGTLKNLANISTESVEFFNIDMASDDAVEQLLDIFLTHKPSLVLHYAAVNGTKHFYDHPSLTQTTNVLVTLNLIRCLEALPAGGFEVDLIYASTSEVYGEDPNIPTGEEDAAQINSLAVRDSYACSKLMGEFLVQHVSMRISYRWSILRIFNVYGPHMVATEYGQVIPELLGRTLSGENPLVLIGNGKQTRSFCYIDDHVEIVHSLATECSPWGDLINLGNPIELQIMDLARKIIGASGRHAEIVTSEGRPNDTRRRCPDIGRLMTHIGHYTFVDIDEGLRLCVADLERKSAPEV